MKLVVFCENRNGVRLAAELLRRAAFGSADASLFTADPFGPVADWVDAEARVQELDSGQYPGNILDASESVSAREFAALLDQRATEHLAEASPDAVILFNDQSQRGRIVARSAHRLGIPQTLIQDGHLDFRYKSIELARADQNYHYGESLPDRICVWGPSMARAILLRMPEAEDRLVIAGAIGVSDDPRFRTHAARSDGFERSNPAAPLRILLLDQPVVDQGKASAESFGEETTALGLILNRYELTIKCHPSSSESHIDHMKSQFSDARFLASEQLLSAKDIASYDLALTYFSSSYVETVKAARPIVFYNLNGCGVVFPRILHPLFRNVDTIDELHHLLMHFQLSGAFTPNATGMPLAAHIAYDLDPAPLVGDAVKNAVRSTHDSGRPTASDTEDEQQLPLAERMLEDVALSDAAPSELAIIGDDFTHRTGVAVSVLAYAQWLLGRANTDVALINARSLKDARELVSIVGRRRTVVINSLAYFWRVRFASAAVEELLAAGRSVFVYPHETSHAFNETAKRHPDRHADLLRLIPRLRFLCVSQRQKDFFAGLGATRLSVVYEGLPVAGRPAPPQAPRQVPRILMVGTMQDRKGVDLFSRVAELAAVQGLKWDFAWVGARTDKLSTKSLVSSRVQWLGPLSPLRVRDELEASDVFFLPSIDDPMPLSVIEAVQANRRIVTYDQIGSYEVLNAVEGYGSFASYKAEAALTAIRDVLRDNVDEDAYAEIARAFSARELGRRMNAALRALAEPPGSDDLQHAALADMFGEDFPSSPFKLREFNQLLADKRFDDVVKVGALMLREKAQVDVLLGTALAYVRLGDPTSALEALSRAGLVAGNRALVWLKIAELAQQLEGPSALALAAARTAMSLNPSSVAARRMVEKLEASLGVQVPLR